ncbi:peptidase [Sphingomonas lenta]|uniref:Peptidase n=2 Tax=Sphingomonas lenta TaxID=1141887 RepID=A0A2A2SGP4_9SPHN|nr:peptidase [Sphingomonas lenta]
MLCVTGLPLVFHDEIDAAFAPEQALSPVPEGTKPLDLDTLLARALADRLGEVPLYLSFDTDRPVVNVTSGPTPDAPEHLMRFQSLDARTGEALPPHPPGVTDVLLQIHKDMMLGLPAELFLGLMGLLFVAAVVSGVVLYVPFMARLRFGTVRADKSARVRRLDRHNLFGAATALWAVVVALTGSINAAVIPITEVWKRDQLAAIAGAASGEAVSVRPGSVQAALDAAMRAAPGMRPQFIAFPGVSWSSDRHVAVFLQGATPLTEKLLTPAFVDARDGSLDAVRPMPWYMQALLLAQPLHFGDYAGLPMKLLWALLDVMTIVVLWTGLRLWSRRNAGPASVRVRELLKAGELAEAH